MGPERPVPSRLCGAGGADKYGLTVEMFVPETVAEVAPTDPAFLAYMGLACVVVAVGLSIAGVQLLVTCETSSNTSSFSGNSVSCSFPFQGYGIAFLYMASLVAILGFVAFARCRTLSGMQYSWNPHAVAGLLAGASTFMLLFALVVTGIV